MAAAIFGMKCSVYMVRASYDQKPGRRVMMETMGADVTASPSKNTKFGKSILESDPNNTGSLGIAISEAIEDCLAHETTRYCLGSVLNHVLLHQTIIGQEAKKQFQMIDVEPDVLCGCIGGGSNFAGFAYPFIADKLKGKSATQYVACEPTAVPSTTRGDYTYDFGDTAEMTPLLKMYTIGHKYQPPPIHAGGLRYHGKAPSMSSLIESGDMRSVAYSQNEIMEAGMLFAQTEGIVPAPETNHAIKGAIDIALKCKRDNEKKVILFNFSGHGLLDLKAYEDKLSNSLLDYEPTADSIRASLEGLPVVR
jgi:tryptophan synthase beta chain